MTTLLGPFATIEITAEGYMVINLGITPPDLSAPIGQFRLLANDLFASPLNPDKPGYGDYEFFSDAEVSAFIRMSPDNTLRAVGYAYLSLAARAATESEITKDYDLQADLTKKAADLRSTSNAYFVRADAQDALDGLSSGFDLFGGVTEHHEYPVETVVAYNAPRQVVLTQAEYDALSIKDPNALYLIVG